jgi:hypothetical protein
MERKEETEKKVLNLEKKALVGIRSAERQKMLQQAKLLE